MKNSPYSQVYEKNYKYSTDQNTLIYVNKSGAGDDWQLSDGWDSVLTEIRKYTYDADSKSDYKNYVGIYVLVQFAGNTLKDNTCESIEKDQSFLKEYVTKFENKIKNLVNEGYKAHLYLISPSINGPYTRTTGNELVSEDNFSKITVDSNSKYACSKGYRSTKKYDLINNYLKNIVNKSENIVYIPFFNDVIEKVENDSYKIKSGIIYETSDNLHSTKKTAGTALNLYLGHISAL